MNRIKSSLLLVVTGLLLSACGSGFLSAETPTQTLVPIIIDPSPLPSLTPLPTGADTPLPTTAPTSEATLPDPANYEWTVFAEGFNNAVGLVNAGDGSGRLFVAEKRGMIWVLDGDTRLAEPFLDIRGRVKSGGFEQGLLGLAFHPNYAENGVFFINYINSSGNTTISRFQVATDPNIANPGSEEIILVIEQPYANHNGGDIAFGPDGFLYIGMGDGGSGGDPEGNAQNPNTLLGKMLRIDVDHAEPYAIPADNPYVGLETGRLEIWASGLRNPWRFSFDRLTGDLYIGDVGQGTWEEINFLPAGTPGGVNFGWDYLEGTHAYESTPPDGLTLVGPVAEYSHAEGGCSVTGGYVYRGEVLPEWFGVYLYGDYCTGNVWGLVQKGDGSWESALLFTVRASISSFGEDEAGEVYLVDLNGTIYKLDKR